MKRYATLAVMGAILASVIGVSGATASHNCTPGTRSFAYCGQYPAFNRLPLDFRVNLASRPSNLSAAEVSAAVGGAIQEWNSHWPPPSGEIACPALCLEGTTTRSGVDLTDQQNTISWSYDFGPCGGISHGGVAVACVLYGGANGHRIMQVDIVMNPDLAWYQPRLVGGPPSDPGRVGAGEVAGAYPELGDSDTWDFIGSGRGRYDVQSVITHELGHALGLLDIGHPSVPWPASLGDSDSYQQTMYRWYHRGTTNKRTLHDGDVAGLLRVAIDVAAGG